MKLGINDISAIYEYYSGERKLILGQINRNTILHYRANMLTMNKISGLPDFNFKETDAKAEFIYSVGDMMNLDSYLGSNTLDLKELTNILIKVMQVISHAQHYLLGEEGFLLETQYVFINPETRNVLLIYVPIHEEVNIRAELHSFVIQYMLQSAQQDPTQIKIAQIINLFRDRNNHINELIAGLRSINEDGEAPNPQIPVHEMPFNGDDFQEKSRHLVKLAQKNQPEYEQKNQERPKEKLKWLWLGALPAIAVFLYWLTKVETSKLKLNIVPSNLMNSLSYGAVLILALVTVVYTKAKKKNPIPIVHQAELGQTPLQKSIENKVVTKLMDQSNDETTLLGQVVDGESLLAEGKIPVLKSMSGRETIILGKNEFLIGRNRDRCDYQINNRSIGRVHVLFSAKEGKFFLTDQASANGTYVNETRLTNGQIFEINENDIIKLAVFEYKFVIQRLFP